MAERPVGLCMYTDFVFHFNVLISNISEQQE